jgi:hypothetical protein
LGKQVFHPQNFSPSFSPFLSSILYMPWKRYLCVREIYVRKCNFTWNWINLSNADTSLVLSFRSRWFICTSVLYHHNKSHSTQSYINSFNILYTCVWYARYLCERNKKKVLFHLTFVVVVAYRTNFTLTDKYLFQVRHQYNIH